MKKIILSLSIIASVAVIVVGASGAYFSDTETSENNTFSAGTMDLDINGDDIAVQTITLTNKAPGDSDSASETLKNSGSLDAELDITMGTVSNYACTDSANGGANDGTEYCDATAGSLGANAQMALYIDVDKDGVYDDGTDIGLKSDGNIYTTGALIYDILDNYSAKIWNPAVVTMATNDEYGFIINWQIPTGTGNEIQGDALKFDITFTLEQADAD
ncbi:M73 family metallopeptidase [Patescibacteria group bacterium]|nr:M73 family metallopeptidase [Patescibacteria group bacterium]